MMPMLRFFRHGDGSFALFNGMSTAPSGVVATLLAYDDTHGTPMPHMPHTGFQRIEAGQMVVIVDVGPPPPPSLSHSAHAGTLSFEMSSGTCRIVTNCGMSSTSRDNWRAFARSTAAHSTLTFHGHLVKPVRTTVLDEKGIAGIADRQRPNRRQFPPRNARDRDHVDDVS